MFSIKLAGLKIAIDNKYDFVEAQCVDYLSEAKEVDFSVCVTSEEIENERAVSSSEFSNGYLESICIYRNIAKMLPRYEAFVMHCAVIKFNGKAYCFAAKSGTGKTTHILLWKKVFGDSVTIINGDKPVMRFIDGELFAFGTPWAGKEDLGCNTFAQVNGICFLRQDKVNSIIGLSSHTALNKLLTQVYFPSDAKDASITIDMLGNIIEKTPIWQLNCNISEEAAILACVTMNKDK